MAAQTLERHMDRYEQQCLDAIESSHERSAEYRALNESVRLKIRREAMHRAQLRRELARVRCGEAAG